MNHRARPGNQDENLPPVEDNQSKKKRGKSLGNTHIEGGSREGNVGHQPTIDDGKGDRQV